MIPYLSNFSLRCIRFPIVGREHGPGRISLPRPPLRQCQAHVRRLSPRRDRCRKRGHGRHIVQIARIWRRVLLRRSQHHVSFAAGSTPASQRPTRHRILGRLLQPGQRNAGKGCRTMRPRSWLHSASRGIEGRRVWDANQTKQTKRHQTSHMAREARQRPNELLLRSTQRRCVSSPQNGLLVCMDNDMLGMDF